MSKTIAILGIGNVGTAIATALLAHGHAVLAAARDPASKSVAAAQAKLPSLQVTSIADGIQKADFVFLTTPFEQAASAVTAAGSALDGKILVDCTNPVKFVPGKGLAHALDSAQGGSEVVQAANPNAHVVKAFTVIGVENMADPTFPGYGAAKPFMPIVGNNAEAKKEVAALISGLGWEVVDAGPVSSSLHLEHLTLLWITLARSPGGNPNFVWSVLKKSA
eukprot:m.241229 g.241229  ORF g.241229 m.241229 type:complete len:221 (+) comp13808_c0_seq1:35-697(+)